MSKIPPILPETTQQAIQKMNDLGRQGTPFLFVIDYDLKEPVILTLEEVEQENIFYKINDKTNFPFCKLSLEKLFQLEKYPISFQEYQQSFDIVQQAMLRGDSF